MAIKENSAKQRYPLSKMNFLVTMGSAAAQAANSALFSEVTGVEASVDVIEFREGNSDTMGVLKMPGLVKHGNVTLKMGYIQGYDIKEWIKACVNDYRTAFARKDVYIQLMDTSSTAADAGENGDTNNWILHDAWVTKYSGVDLNASASEVAVESIELAYEYLEIPD